MKDDGYDDEEQFYNAEVGLKIKLKIIPQAERIV